MEKKKKVILCIDDEEMILQALEEQLRNIFGEEYIIETSDSSEDALELFNDLKKENFDIPVVISDYIMPEMKGDELLAKIHELSPGSLKILLTGHASLEGISNVINNAQLYRFIAKPWDKEDLVLTVKEAIKSFLQEIQIRQQNEELKKLNASLEEKVKQRTQELSIANASKDKFFSIIAHDLKSPFNAILGLTDILISNWNELNDYQKIEFVKDVNISSKNTFNLIQNLLEWSRSQTGKLNVVADEIVPYEIVEENIRVLQKHSENKHIEIKSDIDVNVVCFADRNMISTVFRNLISNAIKFTNPNGLILITAKEKGNLIQFCIEDNGVGMDTIIISKIFDITEKIQRLGTANEEGTGLGLVLCKEFVEKNGGSIFVESEAGKGSKFFFTVPKCN